MNFSLESCSLEESGQKFVKKCKT